LPLPWVLTRCVGYHCAQIVGAYAAAPHGAAAEAVYHALLAACPATGGWELPVKSLEAALHLEDEPTMLASLLGPTSRVVLTTIPGTGDMRLCEDAHPHVRDTPMGADDGQLEVVTGFPRAPRRVLGAKPRDSSLVVAVAALLLLLLLLLLWCHCGPCPLPVRCTATMVTLGTQPHFGLASDDEGGRSAAVAFMDSVRGAVARVNAAAGRPAVIAVEVHSAPSVGTPAGAAAGVTASPAALHLSLAEVASWDW
jgi:hypothetical protein